MTTEVLPREAHGVGDVAAVPLVAAAPLLAGFADHPTPARLALLLSGGLLGLSLLTRSEWGAVPALSFRRHLDLDVRTGAAAAASPWLLGFSRDTRARNTFLALGAGLALAGLLTRRDEMPAGR
ncbi:SPW repeat domain-containing protein [Gemmata sp.]|uniref:SPW repeat domain-containing protein n=1 Tax=Gemmata sp. TaxID=1914242 RepID=UPI003F70AA6E